MVDLVCFPEIQVMPRGGCLGHGAEHVTQAGADAPVEAVTCLRLNVGLQESSSSSVTGNRVASSPAPRPRST